MSESLSNACSHPEELNGFDYQLEGTSIIHKALESDGQESTIVVVEDTGQLEPGLLLEF